MATNYQGFQFNSPQPTQSQQGMFQSQQFFPQPQGNIYLINNFLEMANVPTGVGISATLCLSEGVMYLKTMQNGQPMVVGYKISPFDKEDNTTKEQPAQQDFYNPKLRGHITCCINGVIYDTFYPGDRLVWEAYKVKRRD